MRKIKHLPVLSLILIANLLPVKSFPARQFFRDSLNFQVFVKTEINHGYLLSRNNSRESLNTQYSDYSESKANYNAAYFYSLNNWSINESKHEYFNAFIGLGPLYSDGTSTKMETIYDTKFDDNIFGVNLNGKFNYSGRFYTGDKGYGLVEVGGFGLMEKVKKYSKGDKTNLISSAWPTNTKVKEDYFDNRLRYGLEARAGAGFGKPLVVNYLMAAEYFMKKFYPGQLFSEPEKQNLANAIGRIKNNRSVWAGHDPEKEAIQLDQFLNSQMYLTIPENLKEYWLFGEFLPRYDGSRIDVGPFFNYYNREPDFIYGGYVNYENNKYENFHWNRLLKAELSYNRYKTTDWVKLETCIAFDYYRNLHSKFNAGLKFIPVLVANNIDDLGPMKFALIPSVEYYTELSEKIRMSLAFSYNITDKNDFFIKGPEFSLFFYRSRY
jgi:hypothetical protein